MISLMISACDMHAKKENKRHHNKRASYVGRLRVGEKYYQQKPGKVKIWDSNIQTDCILEVIKPDITVVEKKSKENKYFFIDIAVRGDSNVNVKRRTQEIH